MPLVAPQTSGHARRGSCVFLCERPGEFLHRKTVVFVVVQSAFSSCCFNPVYSRRFSFICLDVWRIPGARHACKPANGSEGGKFGVVHKKGMSEYMEECMRICFNRTSLFASEVQKMRQRYSACTASGGW